MDADKIYAELSTIKSMVSALLETSKYTNDRISRELEIAKSIHDEHDRNIYTLNKILKGNGEKGLIEKQRDLEDALAASIKQAEAGSKQTQDDIKWGTRTVLASAIGVIVTIIITNMVK